LCDTDASNILIQRSWSQCHSTIKYSDKPKRSCDLTAAIDFG